MNPITPDTSLEEPAESRYSVSTLTEEINFRELHETPEMGRPIAGYALHDAVKASTENQITI
jgi:hypothetical protein